MNDEELRDYLKRFCFGREHGRSPVRMFQQIFQFILSKALMEHFSGCHKFRQRLTQVSDCQVTFK